MADRIRKQWIEREEQELSERVHKLGLNYSVSRSITKPDKERKHQLMAVKDDKTGGREITGYNQNSWNTYLTLRFCNRLLEMVEQKEVMNK